MLRKIIQDTLPALALLFCLVLRLSFKCFFYFYTIFDG